MAEQNRHAEGLELNSARSHTSCISMFNAPLVHAELYTYASWLRAVLGICLNRSGYKSPQSSEPAVYSFTDANMLMCGVQSAYDKVHRCHLRQVNSSVRRTHRLQLKTFGFIHF